MLDQESKSFITKTGTTLKSVLQSNMLSAAIAILFLAFFILLILFEYSFSTVYAGMTSSLFFLGILSIWVKSLRKIFKFLLVSGAVFYLGKNLIFGKIVPSIDDYISRNFTSYSALKKDGQALTDTKLAEKSIRAKKEMLGSEVIGGIFGFVTQRTPAYNENGDIIPGLFFEKDQKVMSMDLKVKPQFEGSEGMVLVLIANKYGDFVKSQSVLIPIRKIRWESNNNEATSRISSVVNGWEKVEERVVDFSKLKIERFDQKLNFPIIPFYLNRKLETGNYRIRLSGNWIFFMSSGNWKQFPWQGKTYANNLPDYRPDKGKEFCAVILLNNGEDITPINGEGFILNSQGSINLSLKINVLMRADEFYSEQIIDRANKLTLSNSEKEPLTIIIEKEVKS